MYITLLPAPIDHVTTTTVYIYATSVTLFICGMIHTMFVITSQYTVNNEVCGTLVRTYNTRMEKTVYHLRSMYYISNTLMF